MSRMTSGVRMPLPPGPALVAVAIIIAAVALAGCSVGGPPTPAATTGAGSSVAGAAASAASPARSGPPATASAGTTARPTEVPGPPVASLAGGRNGIVAGELGSFLWDGLGSDAPWVVPADPVPLAAGAPLAVTLDPALVPGRWTARWAPVVAGSAGDPANLTTGDGATVNVAAPTVAGTWGLQVEISFSAGRRAAWYWSLDVGP